MKTGTHAMRVTITTRLTSSASATSDVPERPLSRSTIPRSCSPTSAKRSALTKYVTISQNAFPVMRVTPFVNCGVYQPM